MAGPRGSQGSSEVDRRRGENALDETLNVSMSRGVTAMRDYSLHLEMSRPARVGEKLVSTRFATSATHGFTAVGEPNVAICLLPGTEVVFEKEAVFDQGWSFFHKHKAVGTVARFRQIN